MSAIASSLAQQIARLIQAEGLAEGDALTERSLAARFDVSRSPVRGALRDLERAGVLRPADRDGYRLADPAAAAALAVAPTEPDEDEAVYLAIARDRLAGQVPDRISENALLRLYGITRPRLQALLRRMSKEGWVERLPGNGWRFLPVLTSMETYRQSYTFRQAIEPAALRDPGFRANVPDLTRHLDQQRRLVAGEVLAISAVQLFQINSDLHEAIAQCSGNAFFIDALRRVNRLRRLIEYRLTVDREQARLRCAEHVRILELVLAGRTADAADEMQRHLAALGPIKAPTALPDTLPV
ncbi:GntR family transcriptional regulator [Rhodobacter sp. Har01]|uniref:GntR family transcriptional regulator n=1 Tax=Rhodobacter sp. Har01 TaxID=2883999 RepID=UPI001D066670|nr:GntR family transcriptional regulator [Rhodobacter sp. Har01]MCB6178118.1 GntR family transcriptional regulator [Rhodobacter sp. Har01]